MPTGNSTHTNTFKNELELKYFLQRTYPYILHMPLIYTNINGPLLSSQVAKCIHSVIGRS